MIIKYESKDIREMYLDYLKEKKISKVKLIISYLRNLTKGEENGTNNL